MSVCVVRELTLKNLNDKNVLYDRNRLTMTQRKSDVNRETKNQTHGQSQNLQTFAMFDAQTTLK